MTLLQVNIETYVNQITVLVIDYAPRVVLAILTLIIGFQIIKWIMGGLSAQLRKRQVDVSLTPFLISLMGTFLRIMLLLSAASLVGIETTSFIAILGAAGLAVGLALQGSLANFAGGVLILVFKPFKPNDLIETQGFKGVVKEIQIFDTILVTVDNRTIIIPNGALANGVITNHSELGTCRLDMTYGIGYGNDLEKVKDVLLQVCASDKRILSQPEPAFVGVQSLNAGSMTILVRVWVKIEDHLGIAIPMNEAVNEAFAKNNVIGIMPTQVVYVRNEA